ncbi:MAG: phosphopyruvate hydratase [Candidatus Omnitrophota bacterium]|nr:MAG: phosphopyruvate hydratase [Candidatus Omnitrophota bacterium]
MTKSRKFNIKEVKAREVLDCRGNPTVEVDVITEDNVLGRADAPAGRSRGKYEAFELRDGNARYAGRGVLKALKNVKEVIAPALRGRDVRNQREIDAVMIELDGTENKSRLGANAIVATSLAVAKAAANALSLPLYRYIGGPNAHILPVPMLILIAGGKLAATDLDFQEFNAMPIGAKSFSEAMRIGTEVYFKLGELLAKKYSKYALNVGDEGSYAPPGMKDPRDAFEIILKAIEELGYEDMFILAMDAAASQLYDEKKDRYHLMGKELTREELLEVYEDLVKTFPLKSIEDPFHEDDFKGFAEITRTLNVQIVGDDFFTTNIKRLKKGIEIGAANALLLKVNQVGTLTEALDAASLALKHGYSVIVSERSGQTEDTWLADLAVAINAGQLKNGAPCRSERTSQFNQLLRIEEELGKSAKYAGRSYRRPIC